MRQEEFQPAYLELWCSGALARRVELGVEKLADCTLCPRNCHVNRIEDKTKTCRTGRNAVVSSYFAHFGEERCLRGTRGSGTIFFSWCNLRCVFCPAADSACRGRRAARPGPVEPTNPSGCSTSSILVSWRWLYEARWRADFLLPNRRRQTMCTSPPWSYGQERRRRPAAGELKRQ